MILQPLKILAFAGSARHDSFNKKLVKIAAEGARSAGAEVTFLDFRDYAIPLFDEDLEAQSGLPESVLQFKSLLKSHQRLLLACPEYNGSITPLLKNALDWASRPEPGEHPMALSCFKGKIAALLATSPGRGGGARGLGHVRDILEMLGVTVLTDQVVIPSASHAFDDEGNLLDKQQHQTVDAIAQQLVEVVAQPH